MKKSILGIFVLGICVLAMSSCKKDYTCECSTTGPGFTGSTTIVLENVKKSDAEDTCDAEASSTTGGNTTKCELKEN